MCDSLPEDTFTIIPVTSVDVTTWHDQMHPAFSMILEVFPHEKKGRYSETAHGWSKDSEFSLYLLFFSPLVNCHITKWKDPPMLFMGKLTTFRLGHGFNSKLLYQRVLAIWKKNKKNMNLTIYAFPTAAINGCKNSRVYSAMSPASQSWRPYFGSN